MKIIDTLSEEKCKQRCKRGLAATRWAHEDDAFFWLDGRKLQHVSHPVEQTVCILVDQAECADLVEYGGHSGAQSVVGGVGEPQSTRNTAPGRRHRHDGPRGLMQRHVNANGPGP